MKGSKTKCSWETFETEAYQKGIQARRHTDFKKKVAITTPIMPNTPVKIDFDFLVESDSDPVTFIVTTWENPKRCSGHEFGIRDKEFLQKGLDRILSFILIYARKR